jgi:signal transduction histidine kinase
MIEKLKVSLYYRLFFVFGVSFLLIIATLLGTNKNVPQTSPQVDAGNPNQQLWVNLSGLCVVVIILLLNGYLIRRMLAPINRIKETASAFGRGNLNDRLVVSTTDEIGQLASSFNVMADQIHSQLDALKQMAVGVSHEIRSPLARMRLVTESLPESTERRILNHEIANIDRIVEMTIEREALENGLSKLLLQVVDSVELLRELASYYSEGQKRIELVLPDLPVLLEVDRRRFEMLLKNVLDNCFEHGGSHAQVRVTLESAGDKDELTILDTGAGFDPLNRTAGLGIRLCESIAKAHGMTFDIASAPGTGTSVRLKWRRLRGVSLI